MNATHSPLRTTLLAAALLAATALSGAPAARAADTPAETIPTRPGHLSRAELTLWNSPSFQRDFTQSYLAETDIEPRVTTEERDQMQQILQLISADNLDGAAQALETYLGGNGAASAVFDFTLANIRFQQDKLADAATAYDIAVQKFPKFRRAWKNLGIIRVRQGKYDDAVAALTRVIALGGGDGVTYGLLGYADSNVEDFLSAETAFRQAIMLDPETLDWKMGLARALFKQERYAEAATLCGRLLEKEPKRQDLWRLQANAYIGMKQPVRAAENYEIVDAMGQSSDASLNMLGDIYVNEEMYGLAADAYGRAMKLGAKDKPERAIRAAKVLAARGALDQTATLVAGVESTYGDALDSDQKKDLLKLRARIAVANGAGGEEVKVLEQIVELDPLDGEALLLLGQNARRGGDNAKAILYFERAERLDAYEADACVRHAQMLVAEGKYDEAVPLLKRAQQAKPRDNVQDYLNQVERVARSR